MKTSEVCSFTALEPPPSLMDACTVTTAVITVLATCAELHFTVVHVHIHVHVHVQVCIHVGHSITPNAAPLPSSGQSAPATVSAWWVQVMFLLSCSLSLAVQFCAVLHLTRCSTAPNSCCFVFSRSCAVMRAAQLNSTAGITLAPPSPSSSAPSPSPAGP